MHQSLILHVSTMTQFPQPKGCITHFIHGTVLVILIYIIFICHPLQLIFIHYKSRRVLMVNAVCPIQVNNACLAVMLCTFVSAPPPPSSVNRGPECHEVNWFNKTDYIPLPSFKALVPFSAGPTLEVRI